MGRGAAGHVEAVLRVVEERNPGQPEFLQAVREVYDTLTPALERYPHLRDACLLERMSEPERAIIFRVPWVDDSGTVHINRGFRIQMSSAVGPYKGGLRFHPTVDLGVLKFLAFEQVFKNALTTLPLGGAKGGADFNPRDRSDAEVRRFCQSFMTELYRHIGQFTDIPAGDIGVGGREIGFLFGQYKRIVNQFAGALTGKGYGWGGSLIRPEATGYGVVYFAEEMLRTRGDGLEGKTCLVSGSGNVAQYTVEMLIERGARVLTLSDSDGFVYDPDGIDQGKLEWVKDLKIRRRGRIREYASRYPSAEYTPRRDSESNPLWAVPADCAFPCATQNEITEKDAANLLAGGVTCVTEGANMPTTPDAVSLLRGAGIMYGPAKAANAGGVAVSGLEMVQDSQRLQWTREEVDNHLHRIMVSIHRTVHDTAEDFGRPGDYLSGANIAGFLKVAGAMADEQVV